jgi:hypothetical protein
VCRIKTIEYVTTKVGLSSKLGDDRKEEVGMALFMVIAKIAIKVSQGRQSCLPQWHNVFDYTGACCGFSQPI